MTRQRWRACKSVGGVIVEDNITRIDADSEIRRVAAVVALVTH